MEAIVTLILQFFFELLFYCVINLPTEWVSYKVGKNDADNVVATCVFFFVLGSGAAWISLFFFRHSLITIPTLRLAILFIAPFLAAYLAEWFAKRAAKTNAKIVPSIHYWQAFWLTVSFAAFRFAFAR